MTLNNKNISVILQGTIDPKVTPRAIEAVRTVLPGAFIIVSTWNGQACDGLKCDELVLSDPPPAVVVRNNPKRPTINNTNRMIYGVNQAIAKVQTKYLLKIRTDIILQDASFLEYWGRYPKRNPKFQLFQERILNYYLFAPQFSYCDNAKVPTLFHPSDWMFFGFTADVKKLFDIPLQPEPESSLWWTHHAKPKQQFDCWAEVVFRYAPEQYLFYQALHRQFPSVTFNNYLDITRENEQLSRLIMANNFVILDYRQWHIQMPKYQHLIGTLPFGQTSHAHWQIDYKTYCDPKFKINWREYSFIYGRVNIGEILKTKEIELERKLISSLFHTAYKKHLYRKYASTPIKLKQKLKALKPSKKRYIYAEDVKENKAR